MALLLNTNGTVSERALNSTDVGLSNVLNSQQWTVNGNSGLTNSNFIGTTNAVDFNIRTNNATRLSVLSNGNVGVQTVSPRARLDVRGPENFAFVCTAENLHSDDLTGFYGSASLLIGGNRSGGGVEQNFINTMGGGRGFNFHGLEADGSTPIYASINSSGVQIANTLNAGVVVSPYVQSTGSLVAQFRTATTPNGLNFAPGEVIAGRPEINQYGLTYGLDLIGHMSSFNGLRFWVGNQSKIYINPGETSITGVVSVSSTVNSPLFQSPNTIQNKKIVLYDIGNDNQYYGFGVNAGTLRYQVDTGGTHRFYDALNSTTSRELMSINIGGSAFFTPLNITGKTIIGTGFNNQNGSLNKLDIFGSNVKVGMFAGENETVSLSFGTVNSNNVQSATKTSIIAEGINSWSRSRLHFCLNDNATSNEQTENASISHSKMTILPNGNVGIGTTTPTYKLDVVGRSRFRSGNGTAGFWLTNGANTADRAFLGMVDDNNVAIYGSGLANWSLLMNVNNGNVGIGNGSTSPAQKLTVNGDASNTTGVWAVLSDIRTKKIINEFSDGLDIINKIQPKVYTYNKKSPFYSEKKEKHVGVVAQDLEVIAPYMVKQDTPDGFKYINPQAFLFIIMNAIKELDKKINDLSV